MDIVIGLAVLAYAIYIVYRQYTIPKKSGKCAGCAANNCCSKSESGDCV